MNSIASLAAAHSIMADHSPPGSDDGLMEVTGAYAGHHASHNQQDQGEELEVEEEDASDSDFSDSMSSSPSVPGSDDIDFSLVYALHAFLANVDGQASVLKGDRLMLLDDSNSYWWLIRVLKTQVVGYIPAENIETPHERLARLNKHRNVDLSSATPHDHISGPGSSLAQTRFARRLATGTDPVRARSPQDARQGPQPPAIPGPAPFFPAVQAPRPGTGKEKSVAFTAPTYFDNSGNEWSDEDEGSGEDWGGDFEGEGEEGFEDEEDDEQDEAGDEDGDEAGEDATMMASADAVSGSVADVQSVWGPLSTSRDGGEPNAARSRAPPGQRGHELVAQTSSDSLSGRDDGRSQLGRGLSPIQRAQMEQYHQQQNPQQDAQKGPELLRINLTPVAGAWSAGELGAGAGQPQQQGGSKRPARTFDDIVEESTATGFMGGATKKLTLTPDIAKDDIADTNVVEKQQTRARTASTGSSTTDGRRSLGDKRGRDDAADSADGHTMSTTSMDSYAGGSDEGHGGKSLTGKDAKKTKKLSKDDEDGGKKKKSGGGGLLSGLFSRKKDKKRKGEGDDDSNSGRMSSESREDGATPSPNTSPARASPVQRNELDAAVSSMGAGRRRASGADMFSNEAALRQQQIEAQEAMYRQYGIQRQPGDDHNPLSLPRSGMGPQTPQTQQQQQQLLLLQPGSAMLQSPASAGSSPLAPYASGFGRGGVRPGSLIGSPGIPGLEVPVLKVLRIFAGEQVEAEATFKTVLLSDSTSTNDLIKQAMQRFRLPGDEADQANYFLTVKDASGEETVLRNDQKPLRVFEAMNDELGSTAFAVPSVKRSSVGSISSISSNLSLNPAITRLGMGDFSDDTAVKLYINRYPRGSGRTGPDRSLQPIQEDAGADDSDAGTDAGTVTAASPRSSLNMTDLGASVGSGGSPSLRFAMRIHIYPTDLPENLVFDPSSTAIIPKQILHERGLLSPAASAGAHGTAYREKIMLFPRNVNVSEAVEHALEAFGISEGVVEGGDEVEEKLSKRRSVSRVRYGLAVSRQPGQEQSISPSSKVLDSYGKPPAFRPPERSSKEARRRSMDGNFALGAAQDLQPSDPVFVLRKTPSRPVRDTSHRTSLLANAVADELDMVHRPAAKRSSASYHSAREVPLFSPVEPPVDRTSSPPASASAPAPALVPTAAETIAAQRAAFLSASRNADQGVDITLKDNARIRSSRSFADDRVRYSYIDPAGAEYDISDAMDSEWGPLEQLQGLSSSQVSLSSATSDGYSSALESPTRSVDTALPPTSDGSNDDEDAIEALRSAPLTIDRGSEPAERPRSSSRGSSKGMSPRRRDLLLATLERQQGAPAGPYSAESLERRIDRVLAKVKSNGSRARGRGSPGVDSSPSPPHSWSPMPRGGSSGSQRSSATGRPDSAAERTPPAGDGRASRQHAQHAQQPSVASLGSSRSSTTGTTSPTTPVTAASPTGGSNYTPMSSATRNGTESRASQRQPIVFRDDLDLLMRLVDHSASLAAPPRSSAAGALAKRDGGDGGDGGGGSDPALEALFGPSVRLAHDETISPEVRGWYSDVDAALEGLDGRLDALLARL